MTLWPLLPQVHRTVSPTEMLTVSGSNVNDPPGPTVTSTIWPVGRWNATHSWLAVLIDICAWWRAVCSRSIFARLSPDSARTKNPSAKMAVTQKIKRAPLDIFILLVLFYAPAFRISCVETQLTLCGSITEILRSRPRRRQAESFSNSGKTYQTLQQKGNRSVTSEM